MPHYGDPIRKTGQQIAQIKENAQAAINRAHPIVPKIERARDIFDTKNAFEMYFDIETTDKGVNLSLYFNKPPPACSIGNIRFCCQDFEVGPESHLIQLPNAYVPGELFVLINGITQTPGLQWTEYDPDQGLVWVVGTTATTQFIDICYLRQVDG